MDWRQTTRLGATIGQPHGRVDESNWSAFAEHLVAAIDKANTSGSIFIVDLSGIDYMSSRGLRALSTALSAAKTAGVAMSLAAPGTAMRQILSISRYDKLFAVHDSVDAAVVG